MVASTTPAPFAPIDASDRAAAETVNAFRTALRSANLDAVQSFRWLAPRPPGERDLLSDLAAAEGVERAIRKLSRFWRKAAVRIERVRAVDALESEVYERVSLPGEALPIVTLLRRTTPEAPWRVVCTNEAHDERFAIWLTSESDNIDDVAWSFLFGERYGGGAELIMDGETGVLGDPANGWLSHVRGPIVPRAWPDTLPGEGGRIVELKTALTPTAEDRWAQLIWILQTSAVFLAHGGGPAAYLPTHQKVVLARAIDHAASGRLTAEQTARFWARVETVDKHVVTSGMRQLALPEIEAPIELGDITPKLVGWLAAMLVEDGTLASHGTELALGDTSFVLGPARRGSRRGKSYGRWGAIRIARIDPSEKRPSRNRIRIPDSLR
jgi:hypothetical protein